MRSVAVGAPLGHDEAVYALGARASWDGTPSTSFGLHRPVGMRYVASVGLAFGGSEAAMRALPLLFSLAFLVALYVLGQRVIGRGPAIWTAAALLTSENLLRRSSELLSDVPSLLLVLALMLVVVRECERERAPSAWIILCAPIGAAAFYIRYGSMLAVVGVALAAVIVWHKELLRAKAVIAGLILSFTTLLIPHFLSSMEHTGSLLGIINRGGKAAGCKYLGQGLHYYWDRFPRSFGTILSALAILGFLYGLWVIAKNSGQQRALVFLWIVAVFHTLATGLLVHGEPRYIFLGVSVLALVGTRALANATSVTTKSPIAIGALLVLLVSFINASSRATKKIKRIGDAREQVVAVATWIRSDSGGEPCEIVSSYVPPLTWYAGCSTYGFGKTNPESRLGRLKEKHQYVVLFDDGKRQPEGLSKEKFLQAMGQVPVHYIADPAGKLEDAQVFFLRTSSIR